MDEVNLNEADSQFKYEIAAQAGAENFKRCFSCGTCTASCPVADVAEEYDPRKIIRMAVLGMRRQVLSSSVIWLCARCYNCYARCPQNVKFADVMGVLRRMAVKDGHAPKERLAQFEELEKFCQDLRCNIIRYALAPDKKQSDRVRAMVDKQVAR
ncbi:4Fe-4S dicluster domain-containing protein [candidate division WOR-3 bacterium]|nr:4Fe-4S dicluster domain-containing protein [candidate division WOR-3 bacterium]